MNECGSEIKRVQFKHVNYDCDLQCSGNQKTSSFSKRIFDLLAQDDTPMVYANSKSMQFVTLFLQFCSES